MPSPTKSPPNSADDALKRFSTHAAAEKYQKALVGTKKHQREVNCIKQAFSGLPQNSHVLDFPCGTGRLTGLLDSLGYTVSIADSSEHMVNLASQWAKDNDIKLVDTFVSDVMNPELPANDYDAILCNRLFHHFYESEVRISALNSLKRLSKGRIVISYYSTKCLDNWTFNLKNFLRNQSPTDRVPIPPDRFHAEIEQCGLKVVKSMAARPNVSMQTYVVLEKV